MTVPILEIHGAVKSFGAVRALAGVDLAVHTGEVVALLGDNGAGKSTLIKCVSGVHALDAGQIIFEGEPAAIRNPADARTLGIEMVYQDLALFDNLTAAQNFFAGREICGPPWLRRLGILREARMAEETKEILARLRVNLHDLRSSLALMSGGQRQAIAVARAVAFASKLVILDEPTAALGLRESRTVMDLVRRLVDQGTSVILVSHNLQEVTQIAERSRTTRVWCLSSWARKTSRLQAKAISEVRAVP
jgi:D-xylose transport system ATP-binding protein